MANGQFKIKNVSNYTKEQAIGKPVSFQYYKDKEPTLLGIITNVDKDYLYVDFEHDNKDDFVIEVNNNQMSMELRSE